MSVVQATATATPRSDRRLLFDLSEACYSERVTGPAEIERVVPHRGQMLLLDSIIWTSPDFRRGVGLKRIQEGEFWWKGQPPGAMAVLPGALMVEAAAQLACFLFNSRSECRPNAAFVRLDETSIRRLPRVGEDLLLLCSEVKYSRRRFVNDFQGLIGPRIVMRGRMSGMAVE